MQELVTAVFINNCHQVPLVDGGGFTSFGQVVNSFAFHADRGRNHFQRRCPDQHIGGAARGIIKLFQRHAGCFRIVGQPIDDQVHAVGIESDDHVFPVHRALVGRIAFFFFVL